MEVEVLLEKIFFTSQEFIDNNEISECFEMKFPVMIEKKYNLKKGMLYYYGKYLFTENGQKIMEIKCAANSNTIFYGNYVIADKNLYFIQEIDPVFIALYLLDFSRGKRNLENEGKFLNLEEIFTSEIEKERNFYKIFLQNKRFLRALDIICDKKEINFEEAKICYYRLNDNKLYKWLDAKMLVLAQVLKSNIPHRLGSIENCNQLLPAFDFLYEIIPFAIFDNYLVKHNNITQNEFGKYKQGLDLKKDIKTLNNEGNNSLESSNNKKDNGTAAKKKSDKKKLEQEIKIDKNPITKFFKKK